MFFIPSRVQWIPTARGYSLASSSPTFRFLTALSIFAAIFCSAAEAQVYEKVFSFTNDQPPSNTGEHPYASLVQGGDGNFYGTTQQGGASGNGTVFRMTPVGGLTTLVEFTGNGASNKGSAPYAGLVQGSDGNFYGTTANGGASGFGTIFKISMS